MTTSELIARVRWALDKPLGNHPDDVQLRQIVLEEAQHFSNRIRISQRRGDLQEGSFQLSSGVEKTLINAPGLGTWVYAEVIDPLRAWNRPPVRLIDPVNFDQFPVDTVSAGYPPAVIYGALTSENGVPYFRNRTKVNQEYTCTLLYEQGPLNLGGEVQLPMPEHHNYLLAKCIIKALSKAQWDQPDKMKYGSDMAYSQWFDKRTKERRRELAEPYLLNLEEQRATFEKECRRVQEPAVVTTSSGVEMEDLFIY